MANQSREDSGQTWRPVISGLRRASGGERQLQRLGEDVWAAMSLKEVGGGLRRILVVAKR